MVRAHVGMAKAVLVPAPSPKTMDNRHTAMIPSFTFVSDLDPNVQKNRIPTEAELFGLKTLLGVHSRLVNHLKDEVEQAKTSHERLLAKYHQQLRELEGTQSQLHESKKVLNLMEDQCDVLQAETVRLTGMTHPIRRYPSDLLQYIFEFVYDLGVSRRLQTTWTLSQVCQRWRMIAHDTPRLWCNLDYSMDINDSDISTFWSEIIPRMKAVPPTLVIRSLKVDRLKHLNLCSIPVIQRLELILESPNNFSSLHALSDLLSGAEVKVLEINWEKDRDEASDPTSNVIWDLGALLKGGFLSPTLIFDAACTMHLTPSIHFGSVTDLELYSLAEVNIPLILSLFGKLSTLVVNHLATCLTVGEPVISSSLKNLIINTEFQENGRVWLTQVSCPNLTSLHFEVSDFPDDYVSFVEKHHSLMTLDYTSSKDKLFSRLASVASQIQHLEISADDLDEFTAGTARPPFPSLKTLTISNTIKLQEKQFATIVQTRCLPRHYPDCKVPPNLVPLASLSISDPYGGGEIHSSPPWLTSELFKEAQQGVLTGNVWGETGIALSWI